MSSSVPPPGFTPPPSAAASVPDAPATSTAPARSRRPLPGKLLAAVGGLVLAAVAAFVLFGPSSQATDPIAQAATSSANSPGYRMNLSLSLTSPQSSTPISATGSAVVDPPDHAASMSLTIDTSQIPLFSESTGDSTMQMAMVLDGANYYMKLPQAIVDQLPSLGGKPWVEVNVAKAADLSSLGDSLTSDPSQTLQELRAGADNITDEGQQQVDGVQTTHYQAEVNLDRLVPGLPSSLAKQLTQDQDVPIDVWIDAHNLVRRVVTTLTLGGSTGSSLQEIATADFTDYGPQPRPTPPPPDQVTSGSSLGGSLSG